MAVDEREKLERSDASETDIREGGEGRMKERMGIEYSKCVIIVHSLFA